MKEYILKMSGTLNDCKIEEASTDYNPLTLLGLLEWKRKEMMDIVIAKSAKIKKKKVKL